MSPWHMYSLNIKWIIDTNGIINNCYNSQRAFGVCAKSNGSHFSLSHLLLFFDVCMFGYVHFFPTPECVILSDYYTDYYFWSYGAFVEHIIHFVVDCFFPLWNLHALAVSCRFPLKFSTPIAREIVQITSSVCVCAVFSLCEWNHIPCNNATAIDSQFFKMALFSSMFRFVSFLFEAIVVQIIVGLSVLQCVCVSIICGTNNNERRGRDWAPNEIKIHSIFEWSLKRIGLHHRLAFFTQNIKSWWMVEDWTIRF